MCEELTAKIGNQSHFLFQSGLYGVERDQFRLMTSKTQFYNFCVGTIGSHCISVFSLKALFEPQYIPDEVIDALIFLKAQPYPDVFPVVSQMTTKILSGSSRCQSTYFLKKNILKMYGKIIGACLENGNHWTLFFCDLTKRSIIYVNSFGETEERMQTILKNWSLFASARGCKGDWTISSVKHPQQQDGHSCGVHVVMFAENILSGKSCVEEYTVTVQQLRHQLCHTVFLNLDRSQKCSKCWGLLTAKDTVKCQKCNACYHTRCGTTACGICVACESEDKSPYLSLVLDAEHTFGEDKERNDRHGEMAVKELDRNNGGDMGKCKASGERTDQREIGVNTEECDLWSDKVQLQIQGPSSEKDEDQEGQTESPNGNSAGFRVVGRLSLTGSKKKTYIVTEEEIRRRIQAENMSTNVFRSLIGGRKRNLPQIILNRPKKIKTKLSIFSSLSEGEASELALGLGGNLGHHVTRDMVCEGIDHKKADATRQTLCTIQSNLRTSLHEASTFSLMTHTFGPAAMDCMLSFLIEKLKDL